MKAVVSPQNENVPAHFATTRWSLIRDCLTDKSRAAVDKGLSDFCRIYWFPVFAFICRRGYSTQDAQDLTQDFFVVILEGSFLHSADRNRGRFRSFMIKSLRNFLIDVEVRRRAQKRGGDVLFVSWENYLSSPPSPLSNSNKFSDDALFDSTWATVVAQEALRRLEIECESKGYRRLYDGLCEYLASERADVCYDQLSAALGIPQPAVKRLLHKFRMRYRALLREEIAKTVDEKADIDDEIRYLCATLSAGSR